MDDVAPFAGNSVFVCFVFVFLFFLFFIVCLLSLFAGAFLFCLTVFSMK